MRVEYVCYKSRRGERSELSKREKYSPYWYGIDRDSTSKFICEGDIAEGEPRLESLRKKGVNKLG